MKKILLYSFILFSATSIISCKRDFTCTCTDKTTGETYPAFTIKDVRRPEASATCKTLNLYGSDVNCKLD